MSWSAEGEESIEQLRAHFQQDNQRIVRDRCLNSVNFDGRTQYCRLELNHKGPHRVVGGPEWYWQTDHDPVISFPDVKGFDEPNESAQEPAESVLRPEHQIAQLEAENRMLAETVLLLERRIDALRKIAQGYEELYRSELDQRERGLKAVDF